MNEINQVNYNEINSNSLFLKNESLKSTPKGNNSSNEILYFSVNQDSK